MTSEAPAGDLIEPLIGGLVEDPLWSTFLERLRGRLGADYVSLVFRPLPQGDPHGDPRNRLVHLHAGRAWPAEVTTRFRQSRGQGVGGEDPMPYHDLAADRVYRLDDLLRSGDPEHDLYRQQYLAPGGMNVLRMMRVVEPGGVSAWLTVSRGAGEFAAADDALIAGLAPYLRAALRSHVALERERITASVANEAIRRMNFGWLTLDADGRILDADAHGARLIAHSAALRRGRDGRLTAKSAPVAQEIATAVAALARDPQARPRAIVLSREPWLDMLLVAAQMRGGGAARPTPTVVAYVHADEWSAADRCEQLGELFDLIPSEARLALALSRGMSIAEAAAELGLTVESARTYSKRIYAKTGARGHADLVRFIHRSVLAIA